ncbi:metallophosphoesterase family protein [Ramlibacter ginsenosidimutans]|uniref:Phosphoesterase n=1 Tax=Ramlibacter ginsenosidimutans TaxID=502333 RepID=A0A934WKD9_9BURK|nr:metallophosphoesterase family protein [Ramlibacter ginsenosidimutans]MBK6004505.1 metallophosphoesterase family protein [Ramlibacter ginsenosidimutans]
MPSRSTKAEALRIGVVSDTHNLLRPEVLEYLRGSDHIVHGGDICGDAVLQALRALAPLTAVRGNNDHGAWAGALPDQVTVRLGGIAIHVVHDLKDLVLPEDARVVICGHSHKPSVAEREGVLYVNPGSAGPRRFKLPISAGELRIAGAAVEAKLVQF